MIFLYFFKLQYVENRLKVYTYSTLFSLFSVHTSVKLNFLCCVRVQKLLCALFIYHSSGCLVPGAPTEPVSQPVPCADVLYKSGRMLDVTQGTQTVSRILLHPKVWWGHEDMHLQPPANDSKNTFVWLYHTNSLHVFKLNETSNHVSLSHPQRRKPDGESVWSGMWGKAGTAGAYNLLCNDSFSFWLIFSVLCHCCCPSEAEGWRSLIFRHLRLAQSHRAARWKVGQGEALANKKEIFEINYSVGMSILSTALYQNAVWRYWCQTWHNLSGRGIFACEILYEWDRRASSFSRYHFDCCSHLERIIQ